MSGSKQELISIWTWCGALVAVYGVLLVGMGVYYVFYPETQTVTAHLNPSLWWGAVMVVSGATLLVAPKLAARVRNEEKR
jgi:drug/metabolite transporter (DMT)-like permease